MSHDTETSGQATSPAGSAILTLQQRLSTSGAQPSHPSSWTADFTGDPQLAEDVPGQKPYMNAGNSDIDMIVLPLGGWTVPRGRAIACAGRRRRRFIPHRCRTLPGNGERAHGQRAVRSQRLVEDLPAPGRCVDPFQEIPTFAAKQWHYFSFDGRHFLALAQGVTLPGAGAPPSAPVLYF